MKRSGFRVMRELVGLVRPLTGYMILAIMLGLLGNLCATFITIVGAYAIVGEYSLKILFTILIIIALIRGFLRYGEQTCNHYIAFKLLALIRDKVFTALRRLCPAKLDGKDKGNLISIITSDIELLEVFYAHTISPICIAFLFCVVMIIFIGRIHILLGLLALMAYITVGVVLPLLASKRSGDVGIKYRNKAGNLSAFVLDSLRGLNETIQYNQMNNRVKQMDEMTDSLLDTDKEMKSNVGKNMALTNTVILSFDLMMLFVSAYLMDFKGCVIATLALMSSFGPCVSLSALGTTLQSTFAAGNRVLDILEESPVLEDVAGKDDVSFDGASANNVEFSYGDENILNNLSINVPKGKIIGIMGKSGSGKTTLLKLFMRFWKVDKGSINISNKNIEDINTKNLRDMESYVTQETCLFHDSIINNLRIAKLDATKEEVIEACKKASVHDFIESLPNGYDTSVGELGDTLSGGERQRLGLARAFLHDGDFMLLDEPTSNLDSLNEAVILKSIKEECGSKTVLLVSHRKSTMSIVDKCYSVESGRMS